MASQWWRERPTDEALPCEGVQGQTREIGEDSLLDRVAFFCKDRRLQGKLFQPDTCS